MKKDDIYRSQFRLPYSLYEKLKESAEANNRSVNAELIYRLDESINHDAQIKSTARSTQVFIDSLNNAKKQELSRDNKNMTLITARIFEDLRRLSRDIEKLNDNNDK